MKRFGCVLAVLTAAFCGWSDGMPMFPVTSREIAYEYGSWVDCGPRVVDEAGAPLAGVAAALQRAAPFSRGAFKHVVTAEDGFIPFGAYVSQISYSLEKPGYYSIPDRTYIVCHTDRDADVTLRRVDRPHPMRKLGLTLRFPSETNRFSVAVDLVKGDWLAPYGKGCVADAVVTGVATNRGIRPCCRFNCDDEKWDELVFTLSVNGPTDGLVSAVQTDDELQLPKTAPEAPYDVRTWSALISAYCRSEEAVVFRARGRFGALLAPEFRYVTDDPRFEETVTTNEDGAVVMSCSSLPAETHRILMLRGRVNIVEGERGLEPERPADPPLPSRPAVVPVPADTNLFALGVSPDGRTAIYFGRVGTVGAVPEIFERIVYTDLVSRDLPDLEVLHVDRSAGVVPSRAFAGLARLRSVIISRSGRLVIGSRAFADCPVLNLVTCGGWDDIKVAADAFEGGGTAPSLLSLEHVPREWGDKDELPGEGCWARRLVFTERSHFRYPPIGVKADLDRGRVVLPRVFFTDDILYREDDTGEAVLLKRFGRDRAAPLPPRIDCRPLRGPDSPNDKI